MSSELSLTLLGGLTIILNNQPVQLTSRKARALLCYLAVTGRAHSRSALAGLLWSDVSEANARMNLRKELSRLRQNLDEFLIVNRETVAFNVAALAGCNEAGTSEVGSDDNVHAWLDVHMFDTLIGGSADERIPIERLTKAIVLYHGDFLAGFYVLNSPLFEEWILLQRGRLREQILTTLRNVTEAYLQQEKYASAIETTHQLLALEPWHEEAHRQLMELLTQNGQRAAALAQYEICERVLDEELGVPPSAETLNLFLQLRDGVTLNKLSKPTAPQQQKASQPPTPPTHTLPAQTTPFVGRRRELMELARLLSNPDVRLLTLLGPGGIGKTRLALQVAANSLNDYQHGIYFIPLAPLSDSELIVSTIAANVDYVFENDNRSPQEELLDYLRPREMLLVLDNVEHLLSGTSLLTDILQAAPRVRLLVTSRERLRLMSETVFSLSGLALSDNAKNGNNANGNDESMDAAELFIQTGQRLRPDFIPTRSDWPALIQICHLVGGMPLALILAASWIEMLSVSEIATEIDQSLEFLAADLHDLPERQRSVQVVFDTTWRRLSGAEQDSFKKIAVFHGSFTREAAQAVAGASLPTLTALSHKALIRRSPDGSYEIHELLRQFALGLLAEQTEEAYRNHSAYYCDFLQQREADLKWARQQTAMVEIAAAGENIRVAWQWAIKEEQFDTLLQSLESLGLFYLWQSRYHEGDAMCQQALARFELKMSRNNGGPHTRVCHTNAPIRRAVAGDSDLQSDLQPEQLRFAIRASIWLSKFQGLLAQHESAQQTLRQARAWLVHPSLDGLDTRIEQAQLLLDEVEIIAECERQWDLEQVEQSVVLFRALEDTWYTAQGLDLLGKGLRETGKLECAKQMIEEGLVLRQTLGDTRGIASSFANLGNTVSHMGKFEEAANLYRKSITLFTELNDQGQQAYQLFRLAAALVHSGQFEQCFQLLDQSINIHRELNLPANYTTTILAGFAIMHLGRYEEALPLHIEAQSASGRNTGYAYKDIGRTKLAMGCYAEAQEALEKSLALFRKRNDMNGLGQTLGCLGLLAIRLGDLSKARAYIYENLQIAADTQVFLPNLTALSGVALLQAGTGHVEDALELYTLASQHNHVANSRWFEDVAGQYITLAAATLPPHIAEAARTRGHARQLATTIEALWTEISAPEKIFV